MDQPRGRRNRTPAEIEQILISYRHSGLTAPQFSVENGVPLSSLQRYLRQDRDHVRSEAGSPHLIAVELTSAPPASPSSSDASFELHLSGDRRITIPHGFDAADLARLLEVLGC